MYKIYDTKGFILDKRDSGSDDLSYYIFTKDFGFITAKAYSVRVEKSKMSNFLQTLNFCNLSLTKGKGGWVITGGNLISSVYYQSGQEFTEVCKKIFNLISKLSIREESQVEVFRFIENSVERLGSVEPAVLDVYLHMKVLNEFGYINIEQINSKVGQIFDKNTINQDIATKISENKEFLVKKINESLSQIDIG